MSNTGSENFANTGFKSGSSKLRDPEGPSFARKGKPAIPFPYLPASQSVCAMYPLAPPFRNNVYVGGCNSNHWRDGANNYRTRQASVSKCQPAKGCTG